MFDFDRLFRNFLDSREISDDRLNGYSVENVKLLATQARFAPLATATLTAHEGYFGAISDESTNTAIQKGFTGAMNRNLDEFKKLLSRHEGAVSSKFGDDSPEYLRFFPRGLTEYHHATLNNVGAKLDRLQTAIAELGDRLPGDVVAAFVGPGDPADPVRQPRGVILRFLGARDAQLAAKGETVAAAGKADGTRTALELQLVRNLFTVALDAVGRSADEQKASARLFPQHLLALPDRAAAPPATPVPGGQA